MAKRGFRIDTLDCPVELTQQGKNRFTVTYGNQVRRDLGYADAASELGACLMHSAACAGKINTGD